MSSIPSTEQRRHIRYILKDILYAAIHGDYFNNPAWVVDLNRNGIGLYSICENSELTGRFIVLDLISDRNRATLRSISAKVVFSCATGQPKSNPTDAPKRYGLQFVNLSAIEKRQLDLITKKYALPE